jgi:hypothetical protein
LPGFARNCRVISSLAESAKNASMSIFVFVSSSTEYSAGPLPSASGVPFESAIFVPQNCSSNFRCTFSYPALVESMKSLTPDMVMAHVVPEAARATRGLSKKAAPARRPKRFDEPRRPVQRIGGMPSCKDGRALTCTDLFSHTRTHAVAPRGGES